MKPKRTWFWNQALERGRLASPRVQSAPVLHSSHAKENRDARRWRVASGNRFFSFFLPLWQDSCRNLKGIVTARVFHDESLTTPHSLSQKLKSMARLKTQRAGLSLTEYYYYEPRERTHSLSHNWKPQLRDMWISSSAGRMRGTERAVSDIDKTDSSVPLAKKKKIIYTQINGRTIHSKPVQKQVIYEIKVIFWWSPMWWVWLVT